MNRLLNKVEYSLQLRLGLRANVEKIVTVNDSVEGEPLYATDTHQLFISGGDGGQAHPVPTLDMALIGEDFTPLIDEGFELLYDF
jgi:hypothetical protein